MANAQTRTHEGIIFFTYEDNNGYQYFSYDELEREAGGKGVIVGYLYSRWYGCSEIIDEMQLTGRPTYTKVKEFIQHCKDLIINS